MRWPHSATPFAGVLLLMAGCGQNQPAAAPASVPAPVIKAPAWEYRVLVNESGEHSSPNVQSHVNEGWEVYLVAGGQPYVSSSRTENGVTTNKVEFTSRQYYLRRQK